MTYRQLVFFASIFMVLFLNHPSKALSEIDKFTDTKLYDDPLCLEWTNGCDACKRAINNKESQTSCASEGYECEVTFVYCRTENEKAASKFCAQIYNGYNYADLQPDGTYLWTRRAALNRTPRHTLIECLKFK